MVCGSKSVGDVLDLTLVRKLLRDIRQRAMFSYGSLNITLAQFQELYDGGIKEHIDQKVEDFYCGFSEDADGFTAEDWYKAYCKQYM